MSVSERPRWRYQIHSKWQPFICKGWKSTNLYKLEATKSHHLLNDNITKTYKKAKKHQFNEINKAKLISHKLSIDNRVKTNATKEAFITFKDYKDNFENKPKTGDKQN